jgi:ABC-type multidrug transport system fused ATPase/permease subunit
MQTIKKIYSLLTPQEQKRGLVLLFMILVMALFDMVGVASIMPFMAVLANPSLIHSNVLLAALFRVAGTFNIDTADHFLLALGILVFLLLIVSLTLKAFTSYVQMSFTLMCEYSIGKRLLEVYLAQPYDWFLGRHSADLGKTILSEVAQVVHGSISPLMNLIAQTAVAIALLTLLILIDIKLAFTVGITLGIIYTLIFKINASFLGRIGGERADANLARFVAVTQTFGAAKEVKLAGLEQISIENFSIPAKKYAAHEVAAQIIIQLPRFALEAIAFGGMLLVVLYLMAGSGSFANAVPIVALYAFAGYRLMPALQQVYMAISRLRYSRSTLDALYEDLMNLQVGLVVDSNIHNQDVPSLSQEIELDNVCYCYPGASSNTLNGLSLIIPAKTKVGFVGSTGSGKTTVVDLILGLLHPQSGNLKVDGRVINHINRRAWQRSIGYVPQQIYLSDDSVLANIAFGVAPKDINYEAVEKAAKVANLHNYVMNNLPDKYKTRIGERGVRLSGGQRQRIGIARALYHSPQVLIMDEATSALDNLTELAVMEALHNLKRDVTIILIAHRLSTVKECDTIFHLEKGEIKVSGTFDELMQSNDLFRASASCADK